MKLSFKIKNNKDHCHCVYLWFSERTVLGMWYGYHKNHDAIIIHFCEKCSRMKIGITFVHAFVYPKILMNKESNSTANESKWQFNRSIIYYLNIVPIVNDSFWNKKNKKKKSGAAGTRTHGRGSVPLMSKLDAIPLRHEAETIFGAQISH